MRPRAIKIIRLTPAIGVEFSGVDLRREIPDDLSEVIYDTLVKHQVIFFRDQNITPLEQLKFARLFGEPDRSHPVYPEVDGNDEIVELRNNLDNPPDTDSWHTDLTFRQEPPFASILYAKAIPEYGGDTLWVSLIRAYETLSDSIKTELTDMRAIHEMGSFRNNFSAGEVDGTKVTAGHQTIGTAIHPVVKKHPVSGKKTLYVNEGFTQHIIGMRTQDSNRLLQYLYRHIDRPEHQVRFNWTSQAVAMWDNRSTSHYAVSDYFPHERIMHRITLTTDKRLAGRTI